MPEALQSIPIQSWAQVASPQFPRTPKVTPNQGMAQIPSCKVCEFLFSNEYSLQKHMKILHEGEQNVSTVATPDHQHDCSLHVASQAPLPQPGAAASETPESPKTPF